MNKDITATEMRPSRRRNKCCRYAEHAAAEKERIMIESNNKTYLSFPPQPS